MERKLFTKSDATLTQTGSDVTGTAECGGGLSVDLHGSFDSATRTLALSGDYNGVTVTVASIVSGDGRSMDGTLSAPPLVSAGPFFGVRQGTASTSSVSGLWILDVRNIFSGHCIADIQQTGSQLAATLGCDGGLTGTLNGTIGPDTGAITLSGMFGSFGSIEMRANLSDGGDSFHGIWRLVTDNGPSGTMEGARLPKTCGDGNDDGRVNSVDAQLILQYGAGLVDSLANLPSADVNGDGSVNSIDAQLVLQYGAGLLQQLGC